MNASVLAEEQVLPEREPGENPSFALWNLVWTPLVAWDDVRDGALASVSQDVDMD